MNSKCQPFFKVTIKEVSQEQFPAVSICIPSSWKWPGVIKAMSKMHPGIKTGAKTEFHGPWYLAINHVRFSRKGLNGYNGFDTIEMLFPKRSTNNSTIQAESQELLNSDKKDLKRDFIKWFMTCIYTIRKDKEKVTLLRYKLTHAFYGGNNWWFSLENLLDPKSITMIKHEICNWNIINCNSLIEDKIEETFQKCKNDVHCLSNEDLVNKELPLTIQNETITGGGPELFNDWVTRFWAYDKYWRSDKILESIIYKAFQEEDFYAQDFLSYFDSNIYLFPSIIDVTLFPYYLWHFMQGGPLSKHDQFASVIHDKLARLSPLNKQATKCLEGSDLNSQDCQSIYDFIEKQFNQSTIRLFETWMDQPKVHGNEYDDYVLVPLCSVGEERLSKCDLFKPSDLAVQDKKCFTYDMKQQANVGPTNGFSFLLNLQNIPHDKRDEPLSVDLYLHDSGSYPDVFRVKTFPTRLLATEQVIKVGVRMTSQEVTQNFQAISMDKRNCKLSMKGDKYHRVNCVVDTIHDKAMEECGCIPRAMKPQSGQICDLKGAMCFRDLTKKMKDNFNHSLCLLECNGTYYEANKRVEDYLDILTYGKEYSDYLWTNPIGEMLNYDPDEGCPEKGGCKYLKELDVEDSGRRHSIVHVYFEHPMKNVITQDAKITLAGMVSNIGGTLGIFLGVSMVTLFDDCFQIFKKIRDFFRQKKSLSIQKPQGCKVSSCCCSIECF